MKAQPSFEMPGTFYPTIQRHIAENLIFFLALSDRHIGISVSLRWTHIGTVAAYAVCARGVSIVH
jgi:hypothetical protein